VVCGKGYYTGDTDAEVGEVVQKTLAKFWRIGEAVDVDL